MDLDNDCPTVAENLIKERMKWDRISSILGWKGANTRVSGIFFKAVVQEVLLFGLETWVVTTNTGWDLGRSHHRVDRRIMGR